MQHYVSKLVNLSVAVAVACGALLLTGPGTAAADKLVIESWRNDDIDIWNETIIPAFTRDRPGIEVVFAPTLPAEYNASLNAKLAFLTDASGVRIELTEGLRTFGR